MASAQVLPNSAASSRKLGHLEAGKKRLEEFRKKKAEGRSKKAVSTGQLQSADVHQHENYSYIYGHGRDGAASAEEISGTVTNPSGLVMTHEGNVANASHTNDIGSSNGMHATSLISVNSDHALYGDMVQGTEKDEVSKLYESSSFSESVDGYSGRWRENSELSHNKESNFELNHAISLDGFNASDPVHTDPNFDGNVNHSGFDFGSQSAENRNYLNTSVSDHDTYDAYIMRIPERSDFSAHNSLGFPSTSASTSVINGEIAAGMEQYISNSVDQGSTLGGRKIIDSTSHCINGDSAPWHSSEPSSTDFSLPIKSSSNYESFSSNDAGTTSGRSRPSFLDSLGLPGVSSMSHKPYYDPQNTNRNGAFTNSTFQSSEIHSSSSTKQLFSELNSVEQSHKLRTPDFANEKGLSMNSSVSSIDSQPPKLGVSDHLHWDHELLTQKKDEDFASLEQYIEDLTQEKFSLQRALDTSQNLAKSLAAENSSLTESYNQQGQVVNQLKFDMERLHEEIKAQLLALESMKLEYMNAQLECNAADERAKILASEVITLEEKALRLRSNELKLEKQLDNMTSEITLYRRKVSSLEKERQDFQSTIDALQEEKKLLQSKLRKASTNGKISDTSKTASIRRDAFTSTEDLGVEPANIVRGDTSTAETVLQNALHDISISVALPSNSSDFSLLPEDGRFSLPDASGVIPNDQLRMIENINSLISELALEKEELTRALTIESSNSSQLKDLNKDLSQKLEVQTQRLELLTAQQMANGNALAKPIDTRSMHDAAQYADEGDEVVERVLGWIMKLFPGGGPAKRRTSKLL